MLLNGFNFFTKTRIYYGENYLYRLNELIPSEYKKAIIVTGQRSAEKHGYVDIVRDQLNLRNINCIHYNKVSPNPKVYEIDAAVELIKENYIDLVVGLGGGSVLDAAKAISAMYFVEGKTEEVLSNRKKLVNRRLPLIQIPTTSGTGSELSMGAILTDDRIGLKTGLRGEVLLADIAIVDPMLTYSIPCHLTMETGFDVLTHAIETYLSRSSNRITEMYSIEAIQRVLKYLLRLKIDLEDNVARGELSYASMLMGINLANSSTCLPHRLQYPVGALTDTSHPRGLAAIYPTWLNYSKQYNKERFLRLAEQLGYQGASDEIVIESFCDEINKLIDEAGLSFKLSDLGISREHIPILKSKVTGSLSNDPVGDVEDIIDIIYEGSL